MRWPWAKPKPVLDLAPYVGRWVAVKNNRVVADAATARDIVECMRVMGKAANGATLIKVV